MTPYERWSLLASFGTLFVSVVAFGALAWQLLMLSRNTAQDHDRRRKQATMEYLTAIMERRKELYDAGIPDERDHVAVSALVSLSLSGDAAATKLITSYLSALNYLGVGTRSDAFDRAVVDQAWGGLIIAVRDNYAPWIEAQRQAHGEPRLYEDLQWLAGEMTPRRAATHPVDSDILPSQGQPARG
ncbi:DUF4760 domain-containing protein [Streptomyces sp. NPDC057271]|uniref:DUF4760 domain-containing protein n=1 Tax=unclassified Streptomyces TaxID=2593676 RepID=UPI00362AAE4F